MSFVAVPDSVPMVTTVGDGRVLPFSVAVTVTDVAESSSPRLFGLALNAMPDGAASSSDIVVVIDFDVPRLGAGPPPPDGLDSVTVNVSPVPSSIVSSVVCTVNV